MDTLQVKTIMKCLKVEDALSYLDQVKARFSGQGAIYMDFLDVMRDFKAQTIGTEIVIHRVRELFEGHPDLITGFNTFIPQSYKVDNSPVSLNQNYNTRPVSNSIMARTTSCLENVTPVKPLNSSIKLNDNSDSLASVGLATTLISHDNSNRSTISHNVLGQSISPPLLKSHNSIIPSDSSSYDSSNVMSSDYQENFPSVAMRNSHAVNNQNPHGLHVYQQQQQVHSFNHALYYVNKIKNRFQGIPDVYKRFLDILQWYQKEQKHLDTLRRKQAEMQVYQDVAKLFGGQEDLLQEFSQFLPESFGVTNVVTESVARKSNSAQFSGPDSNDVNSVSQPNRPSESMNVSKKEQVHEPVYQNQSQTSSSDIRKHKRPKTVNISSTPANSKRSRFARDVSIVDTNQFTSGLGVTLLHKIRDALDADNPSGSRAYQTFLQNVRLFQRRIISSEELLETTSPLFLRHVDVFRHFSDVINSTSRNSSEYDHNHVPEVIRERDKTNFEKRDCCLSSTNDPNDSGLGGHVSINEASQKRLDLDFSKLRTCGVSYRALPSNFPQSKCSGRQKCPIAKEVLNDSYISFSSLTSEDSQFVSSKKNQYEENMYRVEDERYEVDMVTELNRSAMQNLVVIKRRLDRMSREETNQFHLDDKLGGTSAILMRKALHRVYGDKAGDVIYGLKNCPGTVIPLVIQRMRQKDTEWRETIRTYQRSWADQDARNYLRSLDHQGATFKQRDAPFIRSKTMVSQIDAIARNEKQHVHTSIADPVGKIISVSLTHRHIPCDLNNPGTIGSALANVIEGTNDDDGGPHLTLLYPPSDCRPALLEDAASLIIHHVKRQSNASKEDKRAMKFLIRTVLQDIFMSNRFPMSDDEEDDDGDGEDDAEDGENNDTELTADPNYDHGEDTIESSRNQMIIKRNVDLRKFHSDDLKLSSDVIIPTQKTSDSDYCNAKQPSGEDKNLSGLVNHHGTSEMLDDELDSQCAHSTTLPKFESYSVLYGNNYWYAFIRLHHLLLCRLHHLRSWAAVSIARSNMEKNNSSVPAADVLRLRRLGGVEPSQYYSRALNLVKDLLDGGEDITAYEDRLRDMFGIYAYPWFTMDRLIINIVRQLHALASGDELSRRLTSLHKSWMVGSNDRSNSNRVNSCYSDISGPLHNRFCRLQNENAYFSQASSICSSFNGVGVSLSNNSNNYGSNSTTNPVNVTNVVNTTSTNQPNCYLLVMLSEASSMLIRLMLPIYLNKCDTDSSHDAFHHHHHFHNHMRTCTSHSPNHPEPEFVAHKSPNVILNSPVRHWYDYLSTHLLWTVGHVPHNIYSCIRPVFLFRTVRHCVDSFTRQALHRRQQSLIDTGDTQPEELLMQKLSSSEHDNKDNPQNQIDNQCISKDGSKSPSTTFEHDVWEFMFHVFKNDLTRRELFRDTFSSDCMQSTDRLVAKSASRNHKINWSVGSYGIFIRLRKKKSTFNCPVKKWHKFHSEWLAKQTLTETMLVEKEFNNIDEKAADPTINQVDEVVTEHATETNCSPSMEIDC